MTKGLPAIYIKKYGVTKRAWQEYRKVHKAKTTKRKVVRVKTMVKRRSYRRRNTRKTRRRRDKRLPISVGVGLATSIFAPAAPGWSTPFENVQTGQYAMALQGFVRAWTGLAIGGIGGQTDTYFNVVDTLNPFTMSEAPAWKTMFWTAILSRAIKKFTHVDPFEKIPFIGKYVKFG